MQVISKTRKSMIQRSNTCTILRSSNIFWLWKEIVSVSKSIMLRLEDASRMYQVNIFKLIIYSIEKNAGAGGAVIAADYVEMGNIKFVATTSNNNSINFWDSNNYIFRERINTSDI